VLSAVSFDRRHSIPFLIFIPTEFPSADNEKAFSQRRIKLKPVF
jgi:hypothetical protein